MQSNINIIILIGIHVMFQNIYYEKNVQINILTIIIYYETIIM